MMRGLSLDDDDTQDTIFYRSSCISSRLEAGNERWKCQSPTESNKCVALAQPGNDRPASNCLDDLCHLNYKWLLERCDDDSAFVCEVLETLNQDGSFHVAQIRKTLSDHSFQKAVFHAEFLASSASNVGAWDLQRRAGSLQEMAQQAAQGANDLGELCRLASEVETAFRRCQSSIAAFHALYDFKSCDPEPHARYPPLDPPAPPHDKGGPTVTVADKMGAVFGQLRARVLQLRQHNCGGRVEAVRAEAAAIAATAADCCCRGLAAHAARAAEATGYVPRSVLDELEQQLDTAEAMWLGGCLGCKGPRTPECAADSDC